jgi:hypothetical protein
MKVSLSKFYKISLCITLILMYFISYQLSVLSKVDCKILVSFGLIQNFEISDLAMVKVEKSISQLPTLPYFATVVS